jgi:hypothetical protein
MAKRRSETEWMVLVKEFKNSNNNLASWCRDKGISKSSIYPYLKSSRIKEPIETEWAEITMPKTTEPSTITLKVGAVTLDLKNGLNRELLSDVLGVVLSLC